MHQTQRWSFVPPTCTTGFIRYIFTRYSSLYSRRPLSGIKPNSGSGERCNSAAGNSSDSLSWAGADCTPSRELCGHTAEKPQQDIRNSHLPHQTRECALLTVGCLWAKILLPICCSKLTVTSGSSYTQDWPVDLLKELSPCSAGFCALNLVTFLSSDSCTSGDKRKASLQLNLALHGLELLFQCVLWVPLHNCVHNEGHSQCSPALPLPLIPIPWSRTWGNWAMKLYRPVELLWDQWWLPQSSPLTALECRHGIWDVTNHWGGYLCKSCPPHCAVVWAALSSSWTQGWEQHT